MYRRLSRLLQEKPTSQILKKLMLLTDVFSGSKIFDQLRNVFSFFEVKYPYSVKSKRSQYKIYAYKSCKSSTTFFLEPSKEDPFKFHMTAFGADIKKGDYIIIEDYSFSTTYRVENIDYYLDPPDLWMALLIECRDLPKQRVST